MKLEEYLIALKECPDGFIEGTSYPLLDMRCGLDDNWPILFNGDFYEISRHLIESGKFNRNSIESLSYMDKEGKVHIFEYVPGTVTLKFYNQNISEYGHSYPKDEDNPTDGELFHIEKQRVSYNVGLSVNGWNERRIIGLEKSAARAFALAIEDIGKIVIAHNIPTCFPWTRPRRYIPEEEKRPIKYGCANPLEIIGDCSSIVYHP